MQYYNYTTNQKEIILMNSFLDNFFKLKENDTNVKTEFISRFSKRLIKSFNLSSK